MTSSSPLGVKPPSGAAPQTTLADVKNFMAAADAAAASKGTPPATPGVLTGQQEIPMTPELEQFVANKIAQQPGSLPEPNLPIEPVTKSDFPTADRQRVTALAGDPMTADVTDFEKDIYCKAVLFDLPVVWDIPVMGERGRVRVRSLKVAHSDAILWWLGRLEKQKKITDMSMWLTQFKRANTLLAVVDFQAGTEPASPMEHGDLDAALDLAADSPTCAEAPGTSALRTVLAAPDLPADVRASLEKKLQDLEKASTELLRFNQVRDMACDTIQAFVDREYRKLTPGRYAVYLEAVALHERKLNKCNRAAVSGNFWQPAGTV